MEERPKSIAKILSPNDTGNSGSHQAGILVPKSNEILSFFPQLDSSVKNPRTKMLFADCNGTSWTFSFIYYNNKFFDPKGTRNEYRLTGMTKYLRECGAKPGDKLIFRREKGDSYSVALERQVDSSDHASNDSTCATHVSLTPSNSWKVVEA